ncbi:MAG: prepilin-type N-terminal cleavage/methylation domain-containing protein [Acidobacteriia bacterium]|nr:prepilin-type N-terminal cleavage/methylation domain-containing protein [Terriglobia bacterium]
MLAKRLLTEHRRTRGFTLIELLLVIAIIAIVSAVAMMNIWPAVANSRVDTAYQTAIMEVRQARQSAVDLRRQYRITFIAPQTILTQRLEQNGQLTLIRTVTLPWDVQFLAVPGIPTQANQVPDGFGAGAPAISFNNGIQIFFMPDGSARDVNGAINNGVLYLARPGQIQTSRAVSLFGATGRIKGWRIVQNAGVWSWQ